MEKTRGEKEEKKKDITYYVDLPMSLNDDTLSRSGTFTCVGATLYVVILILKLFVQLLIGIFVPSNEDITQNNLSGTWISKTNCGDTMWNLNWVVISSEKELGVQLDVSISKLWSSSGECRTLENAAA